MGSQNQHTEGCHGYGKYVTVNKQSLKVCFQCSIHVFFLFKCVFCFVLVNERKVLSRCSRSSLYSFIYSYFIYAFVVSGCVYWPIRTSLEHTDLARAWYQGDQNTTRSGHGTYRLTTPTGGTTGSQITFL